MTRHIPQKDIRDIGSISFDHALRASHETSSEYDSSVWVFVPNYYTEYRYILGTRGNNPLICIGINPSTAKPNMLDPTLKSVERIAHYNGYDSFIMFNVCAQRATSPDDVDIVFNEALHSENMKAFEYILGLTVHPHIWVAWGTIISKRSYFYHCLADMVTIGEAYDSEWLCAGKCSKNGHPHHPLYLKKDEKLRPFDVVDYLQKTSMAKDKKNSVPENHSEIDTQLIMYERPTMRGEIVYATKSEVLEAAAKIMDQYDETFHELAK